MGISIVIHKYVLKSPKVRVEITLTFNAVNAIDNDLSGKWINEDKTRVLEFTQNSVCMRPLY